MGDGLTEMIGVIRKVLVYGFPFFLLFVEWTLRSISGTEAQTFMGPTLASVGVGFLLPLLSPKKRVLGLSEATLKEAEEAGVSLIPKNEEILIYLSFFFIFVLTALWVWTLYLSSEIPGLNWVYLPLYLWVGLLCYLVGVILCEVKEAV